MLKLNPETSPVCIWALLEQNKKCPQMISALFWVNHRLSSYTQTSCLAEPSIGSLIGSLEAEGQLEGREEKEW